MKLLCMVRITVSAVSEFGAAHGDVVGSLHVLDGRQVSNGGRKAFRAALCHQGLALPFFAAMLRSLGQFHWVLYALFLGIWEPMLSIAVRNLAPQRRACLASGVAQKSSIQHIEVRNNAAKEQSETSRGALKAWPL